MDFFKVQHNGEYLYFPASTTDDEVKKALGLDSVTAQAGVIGKGDDGFPTLNGIPALPSADSGFLETYTPKTKEEQARITDEIAAGKSIPNVIANQAKEEAKGLAYSLLSGAAGTADLVTPDILGGDYLSSKQSQFKDAADKTRASSLVKNIGEFEGAGLGIGGGFFAAGKILKSIGKEAFNHKSSALTNAARQMADETAKNPAQYFIIDAAANAGAGLSQTAMEQNGHGELASSIAALAGGVSAGAAASKLSGFDVFKQMHMGNIERDVARIVRDKIAVNPEIKDDLAEYIKTVAETNSSYNLGIGLQDARLFEASNAVYSSNGFLERGGAVKAELESARRTVAETLTGGLINPAVVDNVIDRLPSIVENEIAKVVDTSMQGIRDADDIRAISTDTHNQLYTLRNSVLDAISNKWVEPEGRVPREATDVALKVLKLLTPNNFDTEQAAMVFNSSPAYRKIRSAIEELESTSINRKSIPAIAQMKREFMSSANSARMAGHKEQAGMLEKAAEQMNSVLMNVPQYREQADMWKAAKESFDVGILHKRFAENVMSGNFIKDDEKFWQVFASKDSRAVFAKIEAVEASRAARAKEQPLFTSSDSVKMARANFNSLLAEYAKGGASSLSKAGFDNFMQKYGPSIKSWGLEKDFASYPDAIRRVAELNRDLSAIQKGNFMLRKHNLGSSSSVLTRAAKEGSYSTALNRAIQYVPAKDRKIVIKALANRTYNNLLKSSENEIVDPLKAYGLSRAHAKNIVGIDHAMVARQEKLLRMISIPDGDKTLPFSIESMRNLSATQLKDKAISAAVERITRLSLKVARIGLFTGQHWSKVNDIKKLDYMLHDPEGMKKTLELADSVPEIASTLRRMFRTIQAAKGLSTFDPNSAIDEAGAAWQDF